MTSFLKKLALVLLVALVLQPGDALATKKKRTGPVYAAFVIDDFTGTVLHKTNADVRTYPASLTKVMTVYMLFEALKNRKLTLNTKMKVSRHASNQKPGKLWLKPGTTISVRDALLALTVRSANDVAAVVAEHLSKGSEKKFAEMLTRKARQLGMKNTVFKNASGLPHRDQVTTARDMATMFRALQRHFPSYYRYFKHKQFVFRGQKHRAHTRLLGKCRGVDGVKTGFINASGFNLVSSAIRNNVRIFAVVMGGNTGAWRDKRIENLINQSFPKAFDLNKNRLRQRSIPEQRQMLWANFEPPHKPLHLAPKPSAKQLKQTVDEAIEAIEQVDVGMDALIAQSIAEAPKSTEAPETPMESVSMTSVAPEGGENVEVVEGLPSRHDALLLSNIIANESYDDDDVEGAKKADKGWAAQFGAFATEADAQSKADLLVSLIPNLPGKISVTPALNRRTPLYRARLVNVTKSEAESVCKKMRFHDIPCLPLKN